MDSNQSGAVGGITRVHFRGPWPLTSMILVPDPDACMKVWCMYLWCGWNFVTNEPTDKAILGVGCSMPICMKQEACIYDACMCDACQNGDERTDGKLNSRSRIFEKLLLIVPAFVMKLNKDSGKRLKELSNIRGNSTSPRSTSTQVWKNMPCPCNVKMLV